MSFQNCRIKVLYPTHLDYERALELSKSLYKIGKPILAMDKLIASTCYNLKHTLISKDNHFEFVKEIWNDFQVSQELKLENNEEID